MYLSYGTPKIINFLFGTNGKLNIFNVTIFEQISDLTFGTPKTLINLPFGTNGTIIIYGVTIMILNVHVGLFFFGQLIFFYMSNYLPHQVYFYSPF